MAYLNVRERRIEAKIAYVGASLPDEFSWKPREQQRFRDCDVSVAVVAQADVGADGCADLLREVDGVVVVVDALPSSRERNVASFAAVRGALAERKDGVAIVVQVAKTDVPGALSAAEVVGTLEADAVTHVDGAEVASALEAAFEGVLASMQSGAEDTAPATVRPGTAAQASHPLLDALRQVLRDTVQSHVAELEARVVARLEARLEAIAVKSSDERLAMEVVSLLQETDARVQELSGSLAACPTKGDFAAFVSRVDKVREDVKAEIVKTTETRSRADREYLANGTATLKKSIESVQADVKARAEEIVDTVTAASLSTDAIPARLDAIDVAADQRATRAADAVRGLRKEIGEAFERSNERLERIEARVGEIAEELKKPKKGWFA